MPPADPTAKDSMACSTCSSDTCRGGYYRPGMFLAKVEVWASTFLPTVLKCCYQNLLVFMKQTLKLQNMFPNFADRAREHRPKNQAITNQTGACLALYLPRKASPV